MATYGFTGDSLLEIHANSSVHPIHGETHEIRGQAQVQLQDGRIVLDPPPAGYLELAVDAFKSGHKLQDMEMRRRIEAKKYPIIRYELKGVEGGPDNYKATGTLSFHGVTREFTEEVRARVTGDTIFVEGEHTLDIRDYGIKPPKILNLQVYPEVRVVLKITARPM